MDHSREESEYYKVDRWCRDQIHNGCDFLFDPVLFDATMKATSKDFDFPLESLQSFFRNLYVKYIKITTHKIKRDLQTKYIKEYTSGRSIIDMAKEANFSPALLARRVVEEMTDLGKKELSIAMKNPLKQLSNIDYIKQKYKESEDYQQNDRSSPTINKTRLAREVHDAIAADPLYGPVSDRARHFIGIEYEIVLERGLNNLGILFESEAKLRAKGSSRTPDAVLSCPISVKVGSEWHIVCWIDSKALYGDVETHRTILPQAEAYVNRFGPGLILYWFGHAPVSKLENANGDLLIVGWKLPETILWPTGNEQYGLIQTPVETVATADAGNET
eukprot:jgi/Psemu1/181823/e_gw1.22.195.1